MVGSLKLGLMDEKFCDLGGRCTAVEMVFDNSPGLKKLMTVSKAKLVEVNRCKSDEKIINNARLTESGHKLFTCLV